MAIIRRVSLTIVTAVAVSFIIIIGLLEFVFADTGNRNDRLLEMEHETDKWKRAIVLYRDSRNAWMNGEIMQIDLIDEEARTLLDGDHALVPASFIAEALGAKVGWSEPLQSIIMASVDRIVQAHIGSNELIIDGHKIEVAAPIQRHGDTVYLPLRPLAESFGKQIYYERGLIVVSDQDDVFDGIQDSEEIERMIAAFQEAQQSNDFQSIRRSVHHIEGVPLIRQLPELPRGCEITSLAMLLNFAGVSVDKFQLADQIKRDPTPYVKKDGLIYFGNPHDGFVGDMYSFDTPGLGVYHEPIAALAETYMPGRILDFTGSEFDEILNWIDQGKPVWVIINGAYDEVPDSQWETWITPTGEVRITMREHSVVITGYDEDYIYFNDPLDSDDKAPRDGFIRAWTQMGQQAITYD